MELENCFFESCSKVSLYAPNNADVKVRNCKFLSCEFGVTARSEATVLVEGCHFDRMTGTAAVLASIGKDPENSSGSVICRNNTICNSKLYAMQFSGTIFANSVGPALASHRFFFSLFGDPEVTAFVEGCKMYRNKGGITGSLGSFLVWIDQKPVPVV